MTAMRWCMLVPATCPGPPAARRLRRLGTRPCWSRQPPGPCRHEAGRVRELHGTKCPTCLLKLALDTSTMPLLVEEKWFREAIAKRPLVAGRDLQGRPRDLLDSVSRFRAVGA